MTGIDLAQRIADLALERKALNVVILEIGSLSSYTDFLVIASGTSDRHVRAVAESTLADLKNEDGIEALGNEGLREGQWALVDFGEVVLHVFHQFTRDIYDLEDLWKEAARIPVNAPTQSIAASS